MKSKRFRKHTCLKIKSLFISKTMLFTLTLLLGCTSFSLPQPPTLLTQELRVDPDAPVLYFQWQSCKKTGLFGKCRELVWEKKTYDLNDPAVRKMLIDLNFRMRAREQILPK